MNYRVTLCRITSCLVASLLLASAVAAQEKTTDPVGTWKLSVKSTSQGQRTSTIKISRKDGKLVGLYTGTRSGEVKASEVKLTGSQLSITLSADEIAQGLTAVYVGTIKGDSITGSVEYRVGDRSGKRDFTGSRAAAKNVPTPSTIAAGGMQKDVRYSDKYDRSVLDIWMVKSAKPAPLIVYFHGGGFKQGDKRGFARSGLVRKYHPQGVAFASVNYPFLEHVNKNYLEILNHTAEAIKFLQANAAKYNIDPKRISVMGASAGALIACHLGHAKKLSIASVYAIQQPKGTPLLTIPRLRKDGPPIVVYNRSGTNDRVHHPDNAAAVLKRCQSLGVFCEAYGVKGSGLSEIPQGKRIDDIVMKVFYKSWKLPFPESSASNPSKNK
ncbi:MAG: alpha/beta hydrolase [Pirellulaceae bacterium]